MSRRILSPARRTVNAKRRAGQAYRDQVNNTANEIFSTFGGSGKKLGADDIGNCFLPPRLRQSSLAAPANGHYTWRRGLDLWRCLVTIFLPHFCCQFSLPRASSARPAAVAKGRRRLRWASWLAVLFCLAVAARADEVQLLQAKPDPYGYPRPSPGETNTPTGTSFFFQVGFQDKNTTDTVDTDSIAVRIGPQGGLAVDVLLPGQRFADGYTGKVFPSGKPPGAIAVYIDGGPDLQPSTTFAVTVSARSRQGGVLAAEKGSWRFTTEATPATHAIRFPLDLAAPPARWHGGFFTGFCKPSFCTSAANGIPSYELMGRIRRSAAPAPPGPGASAADAGTASQDPGPKTTPVPFSPTKAWSLQRDFWMTGMEHQPGFISGGLPNVVRERETRRITTIEKRDDGVLLRVEDFFGHAQYGIASGRPLADDYHPGDEVLIADGVSHARTKVLAVVDDTEQARSLLVAPFAEPANSWKIVYAKPLPKQENSDAPGLFPPGGCYLRKFRPAGTPHYYWGRIEREWDLAHRRFGHRLVVNFADAPGDLSVDGQNWTYPKDYAEYHGVVRACTAHLIERYGDACLDFVWSVFNEPDLAVAFWRSGDWNELQKFYDYTVDGILRAFEDHGYDSERVCVGGLEIGAIFGTHIEGPILKIFLNHCSPTAECEGELPLNAAVADSRLDGKRSRRVENLCRAHAGKGSPCDFISVHSYNASAMTAAKLIRAKQLALETDADYYADLWVNCFESCPDWAPPPDVAAADSYLGNGYFPTWCADVARRQLAQAGKDPRFGYGESIITFWPWPNSNFGGHNNATRVIAVDDNGDGRKDRDETVAMPILNFLGLLATMGDSYQVLPEQTVGGHVVSGFAARSNASLRVLLYSHHSLDTQARSAAAFDITLDLTAVPWQKVRVSEFRFDKDHNSYFRLGRELRDRPAGGGNRRAPRAGEVEQLLADLGSGDRASQLAAVRRVAALSEVPQGVATAAFELYEKTQDAELRSAIEEVGRQFLNRQQCYTTDEVDRVKELSQLRVTNESSPAPDADGSLHLPVSVAANGVNFLVIEP